MAYFVVNRDKSEWVFEMRPKKDVAQGVWYVEEGIHFVELPEGSIKRLTGRSLTFEDEIVFYFFRSLPKIEECFNFKELFTMIIDKIYGVVSCR